MGWYHHEYTNGNSPADDGTCSLPSPDVSREETAKEELYLEGGVVYHLCQRSLWVAAIESKQPYFPPTFWSDGRFTRGSCLRSSLVHAANTYYKEVPGDWLCLELSAPVLRQQGIAVAVHRAPETAADGGPAQCLKIYGGISVATLGLVVEVFALQRAADGLFMGMLPDDGAPRMVRAARAKEESRTAQPPKEDCGCDGTKAEQAVVPQPVDPPPKRGFWRKK